MERHLGVGRHGVVSDDGRRGLEYFAWVYSPNHYSRLSTDLAVRHTIRPLVIPFDNIETATAWLSQM